MTNKTLQGKTALITGASKGLGKAMALALAEAGASLVLVARNEQQLEQTAAEATSAGAATTVLPADVSDEEQVLQLEKDVRERAGTINILINNAGMNLRKPVTEFTLHEWRTLMDTNLTSVFLMSRAFIPHMKGSGYGRILNLTSIMSHVSLPERSVYSATKHGLLGFTKGLALELAPDGITVNGISPGPFATELNTALMSNPEVNQQFIASIPLGRWGRAEEIGGLAVFLCSEAASFITGTDILIDGGWVAK